MEINGEYRRTRAAPRRQQEIALGDLGGPRSPHHESLHTPDRTSPPPHRAKSAGGGPGFGMARVVGTRELLDAAAQDAAIDSASIGRMAGSLLRSCSLATVTNMVLDPPNTNHRCRLAAPPVPPLRRASIIRFRFCRVLVQPRSRPMSNGPMTASPPAAQWTTWTRVRRPPARVGEASMACWPARP